MRLADKVAVITGAGSGLGRASAILFAREGAKIAIADVNDANGEQAAAEITSGGGEAIFVHTDVTQAADVQKCVNAVTDKFGKINILFNCAGIPQRPTPLEDLDESLWDRIFDINVKGSFLMTKYVFPVMKKAGSGVVINLASISALRPRPGGGAYACSKGAVLNLTRVTALEGAPHGIRANTINPVAADTPMLPGLLPDGVDFNEAKKALVNTVPLGRLAMPADVASAALYLASDESAMVTGSTIEVDGGRGI